MDNTKIIDKNQFEVLKDKLKQIYSNSNIIHLDICQKRKSMKGVKCKIKGVYTNFLCVESVVNGYNEDFTISYIDLLTKNIIIHELSL